MVRHATNATGRIGEVHFAAYTHGKAAQRSTLWTSRVITDLLGPVLVWSQKNHQRLLKL